MDRLRDGRRTDGTLYRLGLSILCVAVVTGAVMGQEGNTLFPAERTDEFGNATPPAPRFRDVGLILRENPRPDRLGSQSILSRWRTLAGFNGPTVFGGSLSIAGNLADRPLGFSAPTPEVRAMNRLFAQFGGFAARSPAAQPSSATAVSRRYNLIAATKLNTPVQRAVLRYGGPRSPGSMPMGTTLPKDEADQAAPVSAPLAELLRTQREKNHTVAVGEGWARFAEGRYRAAARAFAAAMSQDPGDFEARLGDFFCQINLSSLRSAATALEALVRRFDNPFLAEMDLSSRYPNPSHATEVKTRAKVLAQLAGSDPTTIAVNAFALWFLGESEEALRAAMAIAARFPDSSWAAWPQQMRDARSARPANDP